jgi:hypothetical protein
LDFANGKQLVYVDGAKPENRDMLERLDEAARHGSIVRIDHPILPELAMALANARAGKPPNLGGFSLMELLTRQDPTGSLSQFGPIFDTVNGQVRRSVSSTIADRKRDVVGDVVIGKVPALAERRNPEQAPRTHDDDGKVLYITWSNWMALQKIWHHLSEIISELQAGAEEEARKLRGEEGQG